jgi:ppGpp synthetase/RelA/SpoT-type nucleotidyltranferase
MAKFKKSKIDDYLKEYKPLKELYRDFSYTIKFILENLLRKNSFKYQAITYREKDEKSLKDKLETVKKIKSVKDIDDLAGCRIIFYLDNDVQRVIQYLQNEFVVVKQNLNYSDNSYNALHIIVKLNKDRLKISEYERFSGLKCEIQLTTVLYHSWSELAHDVIYKPEKSLSEFDKRAFDSIKGHFSDVMKNHIKQAQYSFDFIFKEIEKIKQGKQVFDVAFLKSIVDSKANNEIYENLKILLKYIEEFGDKTPKELKIIEIVNSTLEKSKKLKKEPIKTAFGDLPGHDYTDIAEICLDILDRLRFAYPKEVFETLSRLSIDENEKIKKKTLDVAAKMAKYTFWPKEKKIYYHPQLFILDEIEKLDDKNLLTYLSLLVKVSEELLSPSFEGTSWSDHKTFTIHQGSLPAGDTVKKIRERTISFLKKLYSLSETISEKQKVLQALGQATHTPHRGDYTPELEKIILENTNALISYYSSLVKEADNEIIKIIEEQLHWFIKRFQKGMKDIKKLRSLIEKNTEYEMYKVFVGWDYRFSDDLNYHEAEKERKQKIDEYIKQITDKSFSQWQKKILSIIKNYGQLEDRGQFQYFNIFLNELGKQKPEIAKKLILRNEKELEPFLIYLVAGLWQSKEKGEAQKILENWTKAGKHLLACTYIFEYVKEIDEYLLNKIYKKAKEQNDVNALTNIIRSIVSNFEQSKAGKNLFIDAIKELTKHKNYWWVNHVWFRGNSILGALDKNDWKAVLENLLLVPNIDYHLEEILSVVAQNSPKELVGFFYERMKIQAKKKREERYDAIPFDLHKLNVPLSQNAKDVIEEILKWFKKEDWLFYWEGGHFLEAIFPAFHQELENQLIKLLRSKNKNKAKIVLYILRSYKGETFLHNVYKEFIKQYPRSKKYKQRLFIALSQMGVVSGEYGFVEGYERKKQEIQEWKKDKNRVIKNFAKEYENYLSKRIDYEKKRADEDIEIRKREFEGNN